MKNYIQTLIILLLFSQAASYSQQYTVVDSIINQVNIDSLIFFVEELSGEVQTVIGGIPYTILSRYYDQPGNDKAADYIEQKLESYGLPVTNQQYSANGRNVYAVQTGTEFPNQSYIICAHYDDMPPGTIAPGADDNASGTAAVIEAARIFTQYTFPYTVIYALWDEEEIGLVGSLHYATHAATSNDSILGVINLDMIAWDSDSNYVAEIHTKVAANSIELSNNMLLVNSDYNLGLNLNIINPGLSMSDHSPFWDNGYGAVLLIENYFGDFNPYWHTTDDRVIYFNQDYFHKMSKLGIGTLALFSLDTVTVNIKIEGKDDLCYYLSQNYPNPFNPTTTIKYSIPSNVKGEMSNVILKVYDVLGREVATLVNEEKPIGTYEVTWYAEQLPSGVYFYRLRAVPTGRQAGSFVETKKMVLMK